MDVVVVESPAKARAINKYLGDGYRVLASYGHVRDLPPKDGSVLPDEGFRMLWSVDSGAEKHLREIARAARGAGRLYLATDPDREGEAISWHVHQVLSERKALGDVEVKRVVFHEVTRNAVLDAISNPRDLDQSLIDAYLARRALDYLVGFGLSPVLWRKLPGSRSAGRVQSVALRLVCEREAEIEAFRPKEYWTVEAAFATAAGAAATARLVRLDGAKLGRHDLPDEAAARAAAAEVARHPAYVVSSLEKKSVSRRPAPPFTTSTLQQEASRKLRLGASETMRLAQRLYEGVEIGGEAVGLITYMRTDSVALAAEAVAAARAAIGRDHGRDYLPEKPNVFRNRAKNAQEAHEAIRPTGFDRRPADLRGALPRDAWRLYDLVWKRAVASQMKNAVLEQTAADLSSPGGEAVLRASGSVVRFDGFTKLYREDRDEDDGASPEAGRGASVLPPLARGERLSRGEVVPEQHFTKPPPRYSEASLVKKLEELGIGRPSTYAAILRVLQDRGYAELEARRFAPSDRGRLVTAFLSEFFRRYVAYDFTADLEGRLDDVSNGETDWKAVLEEFWQAFSAAVRETEGLRVRDVIEALDRELGPCFFPEPEGGGDPRKCPACGDGRLGLRLGRTGGFIGCSNYPDCRHTRVLALPGDGAAEELLGPRELGTDPGTGLPVTLRKGPYGVYVQLGEAAKGAAKPKRQSLLDGMAPDDVDLEVALSLLSLPREVGVHPETQAPILAGVGRFGPYLKVGDRYVGLDAGDDVLSIGLNRAVAVIAEAPRKAGARPAGKPLGAHPDDGKPVALLSGRYGPYVKHGRINASLPKDMDPDAVTLEKALELIAARAAKAGAGRTSRRTAARPRGKPGPGAPA